MTRYLRMQAFGDV